MIRFFLVLPFVLTSTILYLFLPAILDAQDTDQMVTIYGLEIQEMHQIDKQGPYDIFILTRLAQHIKTPFVLNVLPPKRVFKIFETCKNCCFSPANKNQNFYDYGDNYLQTKPLNVGRVHIFTKPGTEPIKSLDELKNLRVGGRRGMPYGRKFEQSGIKLRLVNEIHHNIKKMKADRIDAFLAYIPDSRAAFRKEKTEMFPHDWDHPIAKHPDSLVCKKNDLTQQFISEFDAALKVESENGELVKILGDTFVENPFLKLR